MTTPFPTGRGERTRAPGSAIALSMLASGSGYRTAANTNGVKLECV